MDKQTYYYITNKNVLTPDDFIRLEQIAAMEYEKMGYKIFISFTIGDGSKVITSLN